MEGVRVCRDYIYLYSDSGAGERKGSNKKHTHGMEYLSDIYACVCVLFHTMGNIYWREGVY